MGDSLHWRANERGEKENLFLFPPYIHSAIHWSIGWAESRSFTPLTTTMRNHHHHHHHHYCLQFNNNGWFIGWMKLPSSLPCDLFKFQFHFQFLTWAYTSTHNPIATTKHAHTIMIRCQEITWTFCTPIGWWFASLKNRWWWWWGPIELILIWFWTRRLIIIILTRGILFFHLLILLLWFPNNDANWISTSSTRILYVCDLCCSLIEWIDWFVVAEGPSRIGRTKGSQWDIYGSSWIHLVIVRLSHGYFLIKWIDLQVSFSRRPSLSPGGREGSCWLPMCVIMIEEAPHSLIHSRTILWALVAHKRAYKGKWEGGLNGKWWMSESSLHHHYYATRFSEAQLNPLIHSQ